MNKEFIPYEQALELKELGFDEPCLGAYYQKELRIVHLESKPTQLDYIILAPLHQQAFRWFREKYGLWQTVLQNTDVDWTYDILPIIGITDYRLFDVFDTYEEAELACLIKLIEICRELK
jgi:hypothetical protein